MLAQTYYLPACGFFLLPAKVQIGLSVEMPPPAKINPASVESITDSYQRQFTKSVMSLSRGKLLNQRIFWERFTGAFFGLQRSCRRYDDPVA